MDGSDPDPDGRIEDAVRSTGARAHHAAGTGSGVVLALDAGGAFIFPNGVRGAMCATRV
jgi:hypothetical protein